ncbi:MAG: YbbR-like protein [Deltaproteobacteria bacterium]|nr:YbbR-like protein [Deltaproteobacteria bacterium]
MQIFGNLGYKLLAVVIAVFIWVVARGSSSVERGFDIPVVLQGVPDDLVVVDQGADVVNVRLLGTRSALRNFDPDRLEYPLEISEAKPGQADFEVDLSRFDLPRGARVVSRSPSRIELSLERRIAKTVKVKPDWEGTPADGYRVTGVATDPPRVRIAGARSEVLRLSEVATETIDVAGATGPVEREVRVSVGPGHVWADSPQTVKVKVSIEVDPAYVGPPAPRGSG